MSKCIQVSRSGSVLRRCPWITDLCSEEDFEVGAEGQDWVLRDLVEKAVQGSLPRLDKLVIKALHHAFYHKLFRQGLKKHTDSRVLTQDKSMILM